MSVINLQKTKLMLEIKKRFPRIQKVSDYADVLLSGQKLGAVNEASKRTRWEFIMNGAKECTFDSAYRNYHLLDKKEKVLKRFIKYNRRVRLEKSDKALIQALERERRGLFAHLTVSASARTIVANILDLTTNNLNAIRKTLEDGDAYDQLRKYGDSVKALTVARIYDVHYDYYWIGFINIPHHYWLSKLALNILSKAR